ncbi:MAG: MarR family transcriptional regulator [Desulfobacterales bacterium]|nr:MarR family transcriptional regulator [Desulfobacterales bacterium]
MAAEKKSVGYRIAKLHRIYLAFVKAKIEYLDIQPGHLPLLVHLLDNEPPLTQEALAKLVFIDKSVAARGIAQLEKKGYLHRSPNPGDLRQNLVVPTPKALAIKDRLFSSLLETSERLLAPLSPEEQATALALLDKMLCSALDE